MKVAGTNFVQKRFNSATKKPKLKIGFALGSGSAKGWAHIGIMRALIRNGIVPDVVTGTSIGALVGGAYACGHLDVLEHNAKTMTWKDYRALFDLSIMKLDLSGLIWGNLFHEKLTGGAGQDFLIEQTPTKFGCVATNLATGEEVWLTQGSLFQSIRASCAIPLVFRPVEDQIRSTKENPQWLLDGALTNPVPVNLARALGADFVISVDLNRELPPLRKSKASIEAHNALSFIPSQVFPLLEKLQNLPLPIELPLPKRSTEKKDKAPTPPNIAAIISATIHISQQRLTASRLLIDRPDVDLAPNVSAEPFDFDAKMANIVIAEGDAFIEEKMPIIREALAIAEKRHKEM